MCKVSYHLLPSRSYRSIGEARLSEFAFIIKDIEAEDIFAVPYEFHSICDDNGVYFSDYFYRDIPQTDDTMFIEQSIYKNPCDKTYEELSLLLRQGERIGYTSLDSEKDNIYAHGNDAFIALSSSCLPKIKEYYTKRYILESSNYTEFERRAKKTYENLVFHPDAFKSAEKLGRLADVIIELDRHLSVLNRYGRKAYRDGHGEVNAFQVLKSNGLVCSGKGSEEGDFKKSYTYLHETTQKICKLTCNPHTKLYDGNNDKRIYFCWGQEDISDYKIIIAKIGDHWKRSDNT